ATLIRLADAARKNGLEFLLEVIPSKVGPCDANATATIIQHIYGLGIRPDWWKLEPMKNDAAWANTCAAVSQGDPWCRGIVVLGLEAPEDHLRDSFKAAARHDLVKGFAVGRTIFAEPARAWLTGEMADEDAVQMMADRYQRLCALWDDARAAARQGS
ncbi:MAG: 2-deoxy-5-keto-D-gluconate 6-phosphate aldolase domain-containing protein, partial [Alphaproteobacteria bacterium]